jgi:transposase InsO family protein
MEAGEAPVARLARAHGVSRRTAYKWRDRFRAGGSDGLNDLSRRPHSSPQGTAEHLVQAVLELRAQFPLWGARKLRRRLLDAGHPVVPAASTISGILDRAGVLDPALARHPYERFVAPEPNDLWQADFKGPVRLQTGAGSVLPVIDDNSRYDLHLDAYTDQRGETVKAALARVFCEFGLPRAMLFDNGSPWGNSYGTPYTPVGVWLMHLGIAVKHGRPYHPQTQGKVERFNGTMQREFLRGKTFTDLAEFRSQLEAFRRFYNEERPHEALGYDRPGQHYSPSPRPYPRELRAVEYDTGYQVRRVQRHGMISFLGQEFRLPKAFYRCPVGLIETEEDGLYEVYFLEHRIATIDLSDGVIDHET